MMEFLQSLDEQLLLWFNGLHTPMMDHFMMAFTGRWVWVPLYVAIAWFLIRRMGWRDGIGCILAIGLAAAIADQTCATFLRPFFARLRPANLDSPVGEIVHIVDGYRGGSYGFPSCHAANSFALVTFFALLNRRNPLTIVLIAWAIANCYTRLYLGVHYPGDLLAGSIVGMLSSGLTFTGARYALKFKPLYGAACIRPVLAVGGVILIGILIYSFVR